MDRPVEATVVRRNATARLATALALAAMAFLALLLLFTMRAPLERVLSAIFSLLGNGVRVITIAI